MPLLVEALIKDKFEPIVSVLPGQHPRELNVLNNKEENTWALYCMEDDRASVIKELPKGEVLTNRQILDYVINSQDNKLIARIIPENPAEMELKTPANDKGRVYRFTQVTKDQLDEIVRDQQIKRDFIQRAKKADEAIADLENIHPTNEQMDTSFNV